jgi:two-component system sensor histidine kinase PhoQ
VPPRPYSLVNRLVVGLGLLSVVLSAVAAVALDALFRRNALEARYDVLDAQVIALIATADLDPSGNLAPATLAEARLATPGSGLYAEIRASDGSVTWRSPSTTGSGLALEARPAVGLRQTERVSLSDGTRVLAQSLGVSWETGDGPARTFFLSAAESLEPYYEEVARVRLWLAAGAGLLMLALVTALSLGLRWGLQPLRRLEREIAEVEQGGRELLGAGWPRELSGVTANLNALLAGERTRLARYRTTLGNLAHSLKTPIAALKAIASSADPGTRSQVEPPLERMQSIVEHQLRRAVLAGAGSTVAAVSVAGPLQDLLGALRKVYRDKSVACELQVPPTLAYPMETGDLLELAGNLLDNAFKYCRARVVLRARSRERADWRRPGLEIEVLDDGPGIPASDRQRVLERGVRVDESVDGQGIGLASARDVAAAYGGSVEVDGGPLGGARVRVLLPGR